jgi:hypothetical protein
VLRRRAHLRAGEALDDDAAVRAFLELAGPLDQPLRHRVLIADEVRELELDLLLRLGASGEACGECCAGKPAGQLDLHLFLLLRMVLAPEL